MGSRTVRVYEERVGEPRRKEHQTEQDTIQFDVEYRKGYGYKLVGRVVQDLGDGTWSMLLATGIGYIKSVAPAKRFSKSKLADCADLVRMNGQLEVAIRFVKGELARRIETGERY